MKYEIRYSKRKTISFVIKDEALIVKAPFGTPIDVIDRLVLSHKNWVEQGIEKQRKINEKYNNLTDAEILMLREKAKIVIRKKVEYFSKIMNLNYGRITITGAKTRFGSCSSKGNLSFSYRLMLFPEEAIDYVVVHELAHLREMNHSPRFYRIIEEILPDYKERKKLLKK